jgi:1,4-dihydroxy-6-naphthoate synthase
VNDRLHLALSPCPNDTFLFHGLLDGQVDRRGIDFRFEFLDIEELNRRLFAGEFDVAKASFHAALFLTHECVVLPTGSALGFGVGPVLLSSKEGARPAAASRVLCPGQHTTATLLYRLFYPNTGQVEQVVFSDIMARLSAGTADLGVVIHEGRFTYKEHGLYLVEDLGTRWESTMKSPLPLGGLLARRRLGTDLLARVQAVLRDSLEYGLAHRERTVPTMRAHAQELDDRVLFAHVDTYVNEWTLDLGPTGRAALDRLHACAADIGLLPGKPALEVFRLGTEDR